MTNNRSADPYTTQTQSRVPPRVLPETFQADTVTPAGFTSPELIHADRSSAARRSTSSAGEDGNDHLRFYRCRRGRVSRRSGSAPPLIVAAAAGALLLAR